MAKKKNNDMVRLSCNISNDLMQKLEQYSNLRGIPRTQSVAILLYQALDYDAMVKILPSLLLTTEEFKKQKNLNLEQ